MAENNNKFLKDVLEPYEIPFMHYGIINRFNFSSINNIPIKRWDPLSFNSILINDFGYDIVLKQNTYGHYSYISPIRSARTIEYKISNKNSSLIKDQGRESSEEPIDIFEPMLKGKHYISEKKTNFAHAIVISDGETQKDDPFTNIAKTYPNLQGNAISMINKFPAMVRVIDPEIYPTIIRSLEQRDKNSQLASGICIITMPKTYYEKIEDMHVEELRDVFLSMNSAIKYIINEAFKQRVISTIPISPFFNIGGRQTGGTQKRVHAQVYMDLSQDGHGTRMDGILKSFDNMKQKHQCHLCNSTHEEGKRIIIDDDDWVVFASGSPIRNYHIRFVPKSHIENLFNVPANKFLSLAKILKVLFSALNELHVDQNRNIIFNTKPHGYDSYFHIFGDIIPFEYVGGAEVADDMRVVRVSPRNIAKKLRDIIKSKYSDLM